MAYLRVDKQTRAHMLSSQPLQQGIGQYDSIKPVGKLTMRGFWPIAMLPTIYRLSSKTLQQLAGQALQTRRGPQYGHVPGRQAQEVVWMLRRICCI